MRDVIVAGDANVDIIVHYPRRSEESPSGTTWSLPVVQGGGTSSNTAAALARLGMRCSFIGTVGNDPYGRFVRDDLESLGVNTSGLVVNDDLNTVGVFAFIDEDGERYLWGWPRNEQSFKVIDCSKVDFETVQSAGWVHTSGMSLTYDTSARHAIERIAHEAHEAHVPVSLDLNLRVDEGLLDSGFAASLDRMMGDVTFLLGSGPEEFTYLGDKSWFENAKALAKDGRTVIARDGPNGCIGITENGIVRVPAYCVDVEDTVGAGDVFNAGFISGILIGLNLEDALRRGNAVSGFTVARKGARSSPTMSELAKFMGSHEQRGK